MTMRFGTVSYNIHCNFTNYGSALQTWALHQVIARLGNASDNNPRWRPVLVDYCPIHLVGKNPLSPMGLMWDADEDSRRMCEMSLPAIRENARKFDEFFTKNFEITDNMYNPETIDGCASSEGISGFVCGSDTIFCVDESGGFDPAFFADVSSMRGRSVAYAASFGDADFEKYGYGELDDRIENFIALGIRENRFIPYLRSRTNRPVERTIDPTLLLRPAEYRAITAPREITSSYLLYYSRRYDAAMERTAESIAEREGLDIIEISLRAENASKHRVAYDAGVEEFLSLMAGASYLVTNSFHGVIFATLFHVPFLVFTREQAGSKIDELLELFGLESCSSSHEENPRSEIDWEVVDGRIEFARSESMRFLGSSLEALYGAS